MATPATIQSERLQMLINDNKKVLNNFYLVPCFGLANAIELNNKEKQEEIINDIYQLYKEADIDAIVLGCTHYPHIKDLIKKYFRKATLLDGGLGVAKETKRQMKLHGLITNKGTCDVEFIKTK